MENNNNQNNNVCDSVLDKIKKGEVQMYSKTYFHLRVIAIITTLILLLITSAFLISYIMFSLRASGTSFLFGFGAQGVMIFLLTFPWALLIIELVLIYILERLIKHFRIGYRSPLLYLLIALLAVSIGSALIIDITNLHGSLLDRTKKRQVPLFVGGMYKHVQRPPREMGVTKGKVVSVATTTFVIKEDDGEDDDDTRTIIAPPGINISTFLKVGDDVIVASKNVNGTFYAYGIQKFSGLK